MNNAPPLPPKPRPSRHRHRKDASWIDSLKQLDAYPKTLDEFRVRTSQGGVVSVITMLAVSILLVSQFSSYWTTQLQDKMIVDNSLNDQFAIFFNVTFPRVSCGVISIETMDASGGHPPLFRNEVYEVELDPNGQPLGNRQRQRISAEADTIVKEADFNKRDKSEMEGKANCLSCFGAGEKGECCNTCNDVKMAYQRRGWQLTLSREIAQCAEEYQAFGSHGKTNGCLVFGTMHVPKGSGSFHFAPANQLKMSHSIFSDFLSFSHQHFNSTHKINELRFGDGIANMKSPLAGRSKIIQEDDAGVFQYYLKIIPTDFIDSSGAVVHTNQYSATEHFRRVTGGSTPPGVFFFWEVSPIRMVRREIRKPVSDVLVDLCAAVGGVYMVMRMVDHVIHTWSRTHSNQLGK